MKKFFHICNAFVENAGMIFLVMMTCIIFTQVFCRYVLHASLAWPEEMARYCFIWLAYCGYAVAVREEKHLKLDLLVLFFKGKSREGFLLICEVINLLFFGLLVFLTFDMMIRVKELEQEAFSFPYPIWLTWLGMVVLCIFCCISAIQTILIHYKKIFAKGD